MSIHVALEHRTTYRFDRPVGSARTSCGCARRPHSRTPILSYSLTVEPADHFVNWQQDPFGNYLARLVFPEPADRAVDHRRPGRRPDRHQPVRLLRRGLGAEHFPFAYDADAARDLAPYLAVEPRRARCSSEWLAEVKVPADGTPIVDFLVELNQRLQARHRLHDPHGARRADARARPSASALGSCRDSGWLLVQVLRHLGLAGPLRVGLPGAAHRRRAARSTARAGPSADFTDLHAWAEVYVPGAGWIGLDPTSGLFAGEGHIPLACTPAPARPRRRSRARPSRARSTFEFAERASPASTRTPGSPCPTPTTQWAGDRRARPRRRRAPRRRRRAPHRRAASRPSCRSTTWRAPSGTTAADGADKRARRGRSPGGWPTRFAARRRCCTTGRASGTRASRCPAGRSASSGAPTARRCGPTRPPRRPARTRRRDARATPRTLARALGRRLGVPEDVLRPGLRGPARRPARRGRSSRRRAARRRRRPDRPAPRDAVTRADASPRSTPRATQPTGWVTAAAPPPGPRTARRGPPTRVDASGAAACCSCPGDSPIGLRLPLDCGLHLGRRRPSRPSRSTVRAVPTSSRSAPPQVALRPRLAAHGGAGRRRPADRARASRSATAGSTCSCRRSRTSRTPSSCSAIVEAAAADLGVPVVLEGYPPPRDPRHRQLVVTPDPGVIEVNVHPAASWPELVDITEVLYDEARQCRLGTEKFELDGTHTGTGGGNHLTLGGADPGRQPAAAPARPAAQPHHLLAAPPVAVVPVLGPVHRPDQPGARGRRGPPRGPLRARDRLRRARPPRRRPARRGWSTGSSATCSSTSPATPTGPSSASTSCSPPRPSAAGSACVELRGFEMPPHPRMALVQALLVRALVARFWDEPYAARWCGGAPSCTTGSCCPTRSPPTSPRSSTTSARHGFAFEPSWLAPFLEFRFPRIGTVEVGDVRIELRAAIEPWLVLGEEVDRRRAPPATSTRRSSGSRCGPTASRPSRHVVTCNGEPVPLRPTATPGTPGRRRALPGLAAAVGAAPHDRGAHAAGVRPRRPGTDARSAAARTTCPPRRPVLRPLPGERQRGRGPPGQPLLASPATPRARSTSPRLRRAPARWATGYPRTLDLRRPAIAGDQRAPTRRLPTRRSAPPHHDHQPDDRSRRDVPAARRPVRRAARARRRRSASTGRRWPRSLGELGPRRADAPRRREAAPPARRRRRHLQRHRRRLQRRIRPCGRSTRCRW